MLLFRRNCTAPNTATRHGASTRFGIAALAAAGTLLGGLTLAGCSGTPTDADTTGGAPAVKGEPSGPAQEDPGQIDPDGGRGEAITYPRSLHGSFVLHEFDGVRMIEAPEYDRGGDDARLVGSLTINAHGCFGLTSRETGRFVPVAFPFQTALASSESLLVRDSVFNIGTELVVGGGMRGVPEPDAGSTAAAADEYVVATECGFTGAENAEGIFEGWGEVLPAPASSRDDE